MKQMPGAKPISRLAYIPPQLCKLGVPPAGDDWLHEVKLDGYRIEAIIKDKNVSLISRNQKDWTKQFSSIATSLHGFPAKQAIIDGELVALDENGISRFQILQNAVDSRTSVSLVYYVFDILHCDGYDLTDTPLIERKKLLNNLLSKWRKKPSEIRISEFMVGNGPAVFQQACHHGLEGIISKRIDSPYQSHRSADWIKSKCLQEREFIIGGYTDPQRSRQYFGALLLGDYQNNQLVYSGNVGTGFSDEMLKKLFAMLKKREQGGCPFSIKPNIKNAHWVKPDLSAQIKFAEWTQDKVLRQPVFLGLRPNKGNHLSHAKVKLSNPDKNLYSLPPLTKSDLAHFYEEIQEWILPHIVNRPLSLYRCPNGVDEKCFYQKHFTNSLPKGIYPIRVPIDSEPYLMIKNIEGLVGLIQMGVLEVHPWNCQAKSLNKPDRIIFDLDPADDVPWTEVRQCARMMRRLLSSLQLESFAKTTGGKGLHVVVPIMPHATYDEVVHFAKSVAQHMVEQKPQKYVLTMSKSKRWGKIFIDYLRNPQGSTAIAPYCARARNGAPVATPVSWNELRYIKNPQQFTLENLKSRLKHLTQDPWADFFKVKQKLPSNG